MSAPAGELIVVHFGGDATSRVPVETLAFAAGLTTEAVANSIARAVASGYLVRRPNGEYDAVLPE